MPETMENELHVETSEFKSLYEKAEYWATRMMGVVAEMEEKLKIYKLKNPNDYVSDREKNLLIMQQASESFNLILIDHNLLLNEKRS